MNILFHSAQFIITPHSTRLATSKNLFLPRVNSSSGKCPLKFIGPKVWSSIPDDIKFSTIFTFKWKLKKYLLHEQNSQLWTLATFFLSRTKYCVFCNSIFYVYLLLRIFCVHILCFLAWKHTPFFLFCFVFLLYLLISFCNFFTFFITMF